MTSIMGHYNGSQIILDENINLSFGQRLIITILDTDDNRNSTDSRVRFLDAFERTLKPSGRSADEINQYIREMRDHDRF